MTLRIPRSLFAVAICLVLPVVSVGQELLVAPDSANGIYQPGQTIRWKVQVKGADVSELAFVLKKGGLTELTKGSVPLSDGQGQIEAKFEDPGWLLVEVSIKPGNDKKITTLGGALVSPQKIQPALPPPEDFDAFWDGQTQGACGRGDEPKTRTRRRRQTQRRLLQDHDGQHSRFPHPRPTRSPKARR